MCVYKYRYGYTFLELLGYCHLINKALQLFKHILKPRRFLDGHILPFLRQRMRK